MTLANKLYLTLCPPIKKTNCTINVKQTTVINNRINNINTMNYEAILYMSGLYVTMFKILIHIFYSLSNPCVKRV